MEDFPPSIREKMKQRGMTLEDVRENIALRKERERRKAEESAKEDPEAGTESENPSSSRPAAPPVPRNWPGPERAIPLEASVITEVLDGFPEQTLFLRNPALSFSMRGIPDLVVIPDQTGCSARLADLYRPENQLEFFLFPPGTFLPSVTESNLKGYLMALKKRFGEKFRTNDESELVPPNTFQVADHPWGRVSYRIENDAEQPGYRIEYVCSLRRYTLVCRLSGSPEWVEDRSRNLIRSLSGLEVE